VECGRCGIVIAKYRGMWPPSTFAHDSDAQRVDHDAARRELVVRVLALPCALLVAWLAVKTAPAAVRLLTMWIHESGHAIAAWVCGYAAWPGAWFTPVSTERSPFLTVLLAGLLIAGAHRGRQQSRWFWVAASATTLLLTLLCTLALRGGQAQQIIVFSGDGGCYVLGTVLMLTMYSRQESPVRRDRLRWGLLALGALAFMDVHGVWTGAMERLPFGENENGLSDPSVLTEEFGWGVMLLIGRYRHLAHACLALLGAVYVVGIAAQALRLADQPQHEKDRDHFSWRRYILPNPRIRRMRHAAIARSYRPEHRPPCPGGVSGDAGTAAD